MRGAAPPLPHPRAVWRSSNSAARMRAAAADVQQDGGARAPPAEGRRGVDGGKMAAAVRGLRAAGRTLWGKAAPSTPGTAVLSLRLAVTRLRPPPARWLLSPQPVPAVPSWRTYSTQASSEGSSRYKEKPWEYLESDEYREVYGDSPVWFGYRRNHKGGIPPQRTRKTCVRKGKRVGNPCPICRDHNLHVDFRNVKLLEQFVCPHSGSIFHPTHTGVCMRQHKLLLSAIARAQDHGLLWLRVPFVSPAPFDPAALPAAVSKTPPAPELRDGRAWYPWYEWQQPPHAAVARLARIYKNYLKKDGGEKTEPGTAKGGAAEGRDGETEPRAAE